MSINLQVYERTIVFVQRPKKNGVFESFAKYADLDQIVKDKIVTDIDFNQIDFPDDHAPISKSIVFQNLNLMITGQPERLIVSMKDVDKTDKYFYEVSRKLSDILVREDISAVGVNFNGLIPTKNADEIIKEKILKDSVSILSNADTASFKLVHKEPDKKAVFIIGLEAGEIIKKGNEQKGILVSCNYHRDIKSQNLMKDKMDEFQSSMEEVKVKFDAHKENIESFLNG